MATQIDRDDDLADGEPAPAAWDERPIFGTSRGLPWWGAILLGFGLAVLGAAIDLQVNDKPGLLFKVTYFVGCVAAVCWVRRRNLFGPMVQPPLILAVVLISIVVSSAGLPESLGIKDFLLSYGIPVINGFPTMAVTTGVTLLIGLFRLFWQRNPDGKAADRAPRARTTGESPLPGGTTGAEPPRRTSGSLNRARPLDPEPGTVRPQPRSRRQPPPRPWEADQPAAPPPEAPRTGRRRAPEPPAEPPRTGRRRAPEPPPEPPLTGRRRAAEPRSAEPRSAEPRSAEPRGAEPRSRPRPGRRPGQPEPTGGPPPPAAPPRGGANPPPGRRRAQPPAPGAGEPPVRRPPPPPRSRRWDSDDLG